MESNRNFSEYQQKGFAEWQIYMGTYVVILYIPIRTLRFKDDSFSKLITYGSLHVRYEDTDTAKFLAILKIKFLKISD